MFHEGDPFGTQILTKSAFKAIKLVAFTNNHEIGLHASYKSLGKKLFNIYVGAMQISTYTCAIYLFVQIKWYSIVGRAALFLENVCNSTVEFGQKHEKA